MELVFRGCTVVVRLGVLYAWARRAHKRCRTHSQKHNLVVVLTTVYTVYAYGTWYTLDRMYSTGYAERSDLPSRHLWSDDPVAVVHTRLSIDPCVRLGAWFAGFTHKPLRRALSTNAKERFRI